MFLICIKPEKIVKLSDNEHPTHGIAYVHLFHQKALCFMTLISHKCKPHFQTHRLIGIASFVFGCVENRCV